MIRSRAGATLPVLLLAVCAGLAWVIYRQLEAAPAPAAVAHQTAPEESAVGPMPAPQDAATFALPRVETFAAIVERPIFSPTRRPPPEAEVALDEAFSNLDLLLVGVVISSDERIAIVLPKNHTEVVRLGAGDLFQGWTVDMIEPDRVTFRRDGLEEQIELSYDRPPPKRPTQAQQLRSKATAERQREAENSEQRSEQRDE